MKAITAAVIIGVLGVTPAHDTHVEAQQHRCPGGPPTEDARCVKLGAWAGIARCESRGQADVLNERGSGAAGLFQFMPRTWRWVASYFGKHKLARKHPTDTTLAQQLRQAIRLRDMPGGGLRHWVCGWAYGTGSKWLWVWSEKPSPHPRRCARNLRRHHGVTRSVARSVCGVA